MDHSSDTMVPLETLRAFDAAARTGSFSAAAEKLNITHGAVSRQIAKLEDWLGLKVFDRGARGVSLTIEGNRLHLRTAEAFALISTHSDRWVEPRGTAVVRLTSIPSVSGLWLMPRMAALENNPSKLRIVLDVDIRQADLADEVRGLRHRCSLQPLQRPVVPLLRDADREVLERRVDDAGGQHPGQEVLAERDARSHVAGERRPEDDQQQHRQQHGEERRLAVAGELQQLDPRPAQADRPGAGQPGGRARVVHRRGRCSPTMSR